MKNKDSSRQNINKYMKENVRASNRYITKAKQYIQILFPTITVSLVIYITMFLSMVLCVLKGVYEGNNVLNYEEYSLISVILSSICIFAVIFIFNRISFPHYKKEIQLNRKTYINLKCIILFASIALLLQTCSAVFVNLFSEANMEPNQTLTYKTVITALITVFIVPVYEEIMFRHFTFEYAKRATGKVLFANIIQAILFALIHLNLIGFPIYIFGGYVLGKLYNQYGLKTAIFYHIIINFASVFPLIMIVDNIVILSVLTGIFLIIIIGICVCGNYKKQENKQCCINNLLRHYERRKYEENK